MRILKAMRSMMGSQWRDFKTGVIWVERLVKVMRRDVASTTKTNNQKLINIASFTIFYLLKIHHLIWIIRKSTNNKLLFFKFLII